MTETDVNVLEASKPSIWFCDALEYGELNFLCIFGQIAWIYLSWPEDIFKVPEIQGIIKLFPESLQ